MTTSTREKLLVAARDVLVQEGLSGLSMRRVAAACDISATAIYRHFADKDELLAQAVLEGFRQFGGYLMGALDKTTPQARLRALAQRYFDFAQDHPHDYQLIFMTDCENQGLVRLDEAAKREISGTFQLLQDRIVECQHAGEVRDGDPRSLAAYVWASLHGLVALMITGNLDLSLEENSGLLEQHLDLISVSLARA